VEGEVADYICFRREPAARLSEVIANLTRWVLEADAESLRNFLAGYIDGDGSYSAASSPVRLQLVVAERKPYLLEAIVLACLRLGILPQVSNNRNAYMVQITKGNRADPFAHASGQSEPACASVRHEMLQHARPLQ
jgi:pyruvate,water dikinase